MYVCVIHPRSLLHSFTPSLLHSFTRLLTIRVLRHSTDKWDALRKMAEAMQGELAVSWGGALHTARRHAQLSGCSAGSSRVLAFPTLILLTAGNE